MTLTYKAGQAIIGVCIKLELLKHVLFVVKNSMFLYGGKGMVEENIVPKNALGLINLLGIKVKKCLLHIERYLLIFFPKWHLRKVMFPGIKEKKLNKQGTKRIVSGKATMLDMMPSMIGLNADWDFPKSVNYVKQPRREFTNGQIKVENIKGTQLIGYDYAYHATKSMIEKGKRKKYSLHPSQRGWFGFELYKQMAQNKDIWLLTADLGYKLFDTHFRDFPERTKNIFASEQAMVGIAVGLALEGKIPVVYSITPFILYRPYEWLRNYLQQENISVKLVGAGRDRDYEADGITHWSEEAKPVLDTLPNIVQYWPETKEEIPNMIKEMLFNNKPSFISLRR